MCIIDHPSEPLIVRGETRRSILAINTLIQEMLKDGQNVGHSDWRLYLGCNALSQLAVEATEKEVLRSWTLHLPYDRLIRDEMKAIYIYQDAHLEIHSERGVLIENETVMLYRVSDGKIYRAFM